MGRELFSLLSLLCRGAVLAALLVLLGLAVTGPAHAQSASPEELAKRHHERGTMYYNLGQFEEAIAEYRKGYEQKAHPVFLFNIAQAYRQLGVHDRALFFYRRYLSTYPEAPDRQHVEERIAALEEVLAAHNRAKTAEPAAPIAGPPLATQPTTAAPGLIPAAGVSRTGDVDRQRPVWERWWFWAGAGSLVLGGVATALLLSAGSGGPPDTELGRKRFF